MVTEPTPAALSDLKRVAEVVNHFKVPLGMVLNRSDIHPDSNKAVKEFAVDNGFPILVEIPYDNTLPRAVANAQPVVSAYPSSPASLALQQLADSLAERISKLS